MKIKVEVPFEAFQPLSEAVKEFEREYIALALYYANGKRLRLQTY